MSCAATAEAQKKPVMVTCYNNACNMPGKEFNPAENHDTACLFHPGAPLFHEGYKGWTCCKKRVTCFDEWLDMKGCTEGPHNPVKPDKAQEVALSEREKAAKQGSQQAAQNTSSTNSPMVNLREEQRTTGDESAQKYIYAPPVEKEMEKLNNQRPDLNSAKKSLPIKTLASLKKQVEIATKKLAELRLNQELAKKDANSKNIKIAPGTLCCRNGCKATYPDMNNCVYHPGVEVFHEGVKYWSCCQRITSDFNAFLAQEGCTTADEHLWFDPNAKRKTNLRWDFFQQGNAITINFYAKAAILESFKCSLNAVSIEVYCKYEAGSQQFEFKTDFFDQIDLDNPANKVQIGGTKIEIKLVKKNLITWPAGQIWQNQENFAFKPSLVDENDDKKKQETKKESGATGSQAFGKNSDIVSKTTNFKISDITKANFKFGNKKIADDSGDESSDLGDYL